MPTFDPVTRQGLAISNLFTAEMFIALGLLILIFGWMITSLVRFRARAGQTTEPAQVHGNRRLEILWTGTPALVLLVIFGFVVHTMADVDAVQPSAMRVQAIGHQWFWEFRFPDQQVVTANELHLPVGTPLEIDLDSPDVIHSFWVPHFGWMRDVVPGKTNQIQVMVDRPGTYDGVCTQYCGLEHAWMRFLVVAEPPDQFQAWLNQQAQLAQVTNQSGERVFLQNTCVNCHTIAGLSAQAAVGPDLTHFGSRSTLGAGVLPNTPENLKQWISNPQAIKPGVLMPAFPSLSDDDLNALVSYLESLK